MANFSVCMQRISCVSPAKQHFRHCISWMERRMRAGFQHFLLNSAGCMQPSMGNLNSPSSRVVKDSTPSWRRILRYINFGIGESSPILFFGHGESSPNNIWSMVNLERTCVLLFYHFLYFKVNLDLEKTNQLGESSPNFIFVVVNLDPIILEMRWIDGESWPNDFDEKVNRGEDLRWVGSRCPLMRALRKRAMSAVYGGQGGPVLKPAVAKILKQPFCPFLSSIFFVSNRPWAAQNQAAHVAIAKTPQRPVCLWWWGPSVAFFPAWNTFFLVEISILVDPKQISVVSKSEKQKKKKVLCHPRLLFHWATLT